MKWVCKICGYLYDEEKGDPDNGIEPGTKVDEDFVCPACGVSGEDFEQVK